MYSSWVIINNLFPDFRLRKLICQNVIGHLYLRVPRIMMLFEEMQISLEFDKISKAGM